MKNKITFYIFFVVILILSSCEEPNEPLVEPENPLGANTAEDNSQIVQELNNLIKPINGATPELDDSDLLSLAEIGNAKIVGLGEATHGTKEFFQLKHRIFRYLVEKHNFKVFAFEADMGESIYIDRYITTGEGDLTEIMQTKMHFWTWQTEEVKTLLEWMKDYNSTKSTEEQIHYIGVDCQIMHYQHELVLSYIDQNAHTYLDEFNAKLDTFKTISNFSYDQRSNYFENLNIDSKNNLLSVLDTLIEKMNSIKDLLINNSTEYEFKNMKQLIWNISQTMIVMFNYYHQNNTENFRDKYMAENTLWIDDLFSGKTKVALWAHNGHVANDGILLGGGGSMGYRIKNAIGTDYQIIGFSFSKGFFRAKGHDGTNNTQLSEQKISTTPFKNSTNYIFFNAKYDNFILRISEISVDTEFYKWVTNSNPLLWIGAVYNNNPSSYYYSTVLQLQYDYIINYDLTSAAIPLNLQKQNLINPDLHY